MAGAPKLNVVLREPTHRDRDNLKVKLKFIFEQAGFDCDLREALSFDEICELIKQQKCDILVTDLTLGRGGYPGLHDVREFKKLFPYLFAIIVSSDTMDISITESDLPKHDMFLIKGIVLNGGEQELARIGTRISESYALLPPLMMRGVTAVPPTQVGEQPLTEHDIRMIARQCLWTKNTYDVPIAPLALNLQQLSGGFSGSRVFKIEVECQSPDAQYVPLVMKISEISRACIERDNYNQFVKWLLPAPNRVEIMGFGTTECWGGLLYSFAFGGEKPLANLTVPIREANISGTKSILERVFVAQQRGFFRVKTQATQSSVGHRYTQRYFNSASKIDACRQKFTASAASNFAIVRHQNKYSSGAHSIADPFRFLFNEFTDKQYHSAIIHGDFNSNNIITYGDDVVFIDFQDVGRGHLFEDFVAIESSIRLYYNIANPNQRDSFDLIEAERQLWDGKIPADPRYELIDMVRKEAFKRFPNIPHWEYVYAVAAIHLRLHRLADVGNFHMARLTSSVVAAMERLEGLRIEN